MTTKGLVICANEQQWWQVEQVAKQTPGEPVRGALRSLLVTLQRALALQVIQLTNSDLEAEPELHTLVDGIDATLIDLVTEEVGEAALVAEAVRLADQTFASQQADAASKKLLQGVFELRARRVFGFGATGRLKWIRETGARMRLVESVELDLLTRRPRWDDVTDPIEPAMVACFLEWAWAQADVQEALRVSHRLEERADTSALKQPFFECIGAWLKGLRFREIALLSRLELDDYLGVHAQVVSYVLQTVIEQGVALLSKALEGQGSVLAPAIQAFPEHLRFGVPTTAARVISNAGVRHRSSAVELGNVLRNSGNDRSTLIASARSSLLTYPVEWKARLGDLVYRNTLTDLSSAMGESQADSE